MQNHDQRMADFGLTPEEYEATKRTYLHDESEFWPDDDAAQQALFEASPQDFWLHMARTFDLDAPLTLRWMVEHADCDRAVAQLIFWRCMVRYPFTTPMEADHLLETQDYDLRDKSSFAEMREAGLYDAGVDEHGGYELHRVMRIVRERIAAGTYESALRLTASEMNEHRAAFEHDLERGRANGWSDADRPFEVPEELSAPLAGRDAQTAGVMRPPEDKIVATYLVDHFPYGTPDVARSATAAAGFTKKPNRPVEAYLATLRARAAKAAAEPDPYKWLNAETARKKARQAAKEEALTPSDWLLYAGCVLLLASYPAYRLWLMLAH